MKLRKLLNEASDQKQVIKKIADTLIPKFLKYAKNEDDLWWPDFLSGLSEKEQKTFVPSNLNQKAREDLYLLIWGDPTFGEKFVKEFKKGKLNEEGLKEFFVYHINDMFNDMTQKRKAPRIKDHEIKTPSGKIKVIKRMDTSSLN